MGGGKKNDSSSNDMMLDSTGGGQPPPSADKQQPSLLQSFATRVTVISSIVTSVVAIGSQYDRIRLFVYDMIGLRYYIHLGRIASNLVIFGMVVTFVGVALIIRLSLSKPNTLLEKLRFYGLTLTGAPVVGFLGYIWTTPSDVNETLAPYDASLRAVIKEQYIAAGPHAGGFTFSLQHVQDDPQPWTAAQALAGLLQPTTLKTREDYAIIAGGLQYLQNTRTKGRNDGWPYMEGIPPGVTEVNGWVVIAEALALRDHALGHVTSISGQELSSYLERDMNELLSRQHLDGAFSSVAFSNVSTEERTYPTVVALLALVITAETLNAHSETWDQREKIKRLVAKLIDLAQTADGGIVGWWPNPNNRRQDGSCLGLTSQAIFALELAKLDGFLSVTKSDEFKHIRTQYLRNLTSSTGLSASISSLAMNANCQTSETDAYIPSAQFRMETSIFLWYPWTLAALAVTHMDKELSPSDKAQVATLLPRLILRASEATTFATSHQAVYPAAETVFAIGYVKTILAESLGKANS